MIRAVDPRRLEMLLELARLGSMREVADQLGVTTSTVSQQLAALGRDVRAPLLEPDGRRVRLTPAGRRLAGHAVTILAAVEAARADLDPDADPHGQVRVASVRLRRPTPPDPDGVAPRRRRLGRHPADLRARTGRRRSTCSPATASTSRSSTTTTSLRAGCRPRPGPAPSTGSAGALAYPPGQTPPAAPARSSPACAIRTGSSTRATPPTTRRFTPSRRWRVSPRVSPIAPTASNWCRTWSPRASASECCRRRCRPGRASRSPR